MLFIDDMDPNGEVEIYVLVRAMYGVTCTGNQAETAIRRAARHFQEEYPLGAEAILERTYVDDGLPTQDTRSLLEQTMKQVIAILAFIGFLIKVFTLVFDLILSEKATKDGESIGVCGMAWYPTTDLYSLAKGEINFYQKIRGKKKDNPKPVVTSEDVDDVIVPMSFNKAALVGKLSEVYNLDGTVEIMKMEHKILQRIHGIGQLDWKDEVPSEQREIWMQCFRNIQDARSIKWQRAVVPINAVDPKRMRLIETNDGSQYGSACAVYAGFELPDGTYSSHLLFARSTINDPNYTVPRNEEIGSVLGAQCLYILTHVFKNRTEDIISVGDSTVNLCWETNSDLRLKTWVFTRVRLIQRLAANIPRYWVSGKQNPADHATKLGYTLDLLKEGSTWIAGFPWMKSTIQEMINSKTLIHSDNISGQLSEEERKQIKEEELPTLGEIFNLVEKSVVAKKVRFSKKIEIRIIPSRKEMLEESKRQKLRDNIKSAPEPQIITIPDDEDLIDLSDDLSPSTASGRCDIRQSKLSSLLKSNNDSDFNINEKYWSPKDGVDIRFSKIKVNEYTPVGETQRTLFINETDLDCVFELNEDSKQVLGIITPDTQQVIQISRSDPNIQGIKSEILEINPDTLSSHSFTGGRVIPETSFVATRKNSNSDVHPGEALARLDKPQATKHGRCRCKRCESTCLVDPVFYGLRKCLLFTSVWAKFTASCHHRTHIGLKFRNEKPHIVQSLEEKCIICSYRCAVCKFTIEKCDTCLEENRETKPQVDTESFTPGNNGALDRIFKINLEETDFFEESETRPELIIEGKVNEYTPVGETQRTLFAKTTSTKKRSIKKRNMFQKDIERSLELREQYDKIKLDKLKKVPVYLDKIPQDRYIRISDCFRRQSWCFLMKIASNEVSKTMKPAQLSRYIYVKDQGIFYYTGRLLTLDSIEIKDTHKNVFYDAPEISFVVPVVSPTSPIGYSIAMHVHWELIPHRGNHAQERALVQIVHIPSGRRLINHIKRDCKRCRVMIAKTLDQIMGGLSPYRVMIAPPFYAIQLDVCSPFVAHCIHGKRSRIPIFALVIICVTTGAVGIYALEKEDAKSIVKAVMRHSCRYGFPSINFTDKGSGIGKASKLKVILRSATDQLSRQIGLENHFKAVQSHGERGRVERVIKTIRSMLAKTIVTQTKNSVMGWETIFAIVANMINNVPIARIASSTTSSRGEADEILTPNRILLGRNNFRSLERIDRSGTNLDTVMEKNHKIQKLFHELLLKNIFELVPQPKWFKNDRDLNIGDIVLFIYKESNYTTDHHWRLGRVVKILSNQKPTKVIIEYKNDKETTFRQTERITRELVVIHKHDDLDYHSKAHQEVLFTLSHFSLRFQKMERTSVKFVVLY